ncbi:MAG: STAS domain-containing protein [Spirochaetia bacterium]|nr:STAS domain-containing protein [Spirochaetia bacterium]
MKAEKNGDIMIISFETTSLNAGNVKDFKANIQPYLDSEKFIILDLRNLTFIDSSGLGSFLSCLKALNQKGGDLKICNVTKSVRILFEMVRMHQVIDTYDSREEAVQAFS